MDQTAPHLLTAGMKIPVASHTLDLGREVLLDGDGRVVELRPQAYQVLRHLVVHAGQLVSKEELLAAVWPNLIVTDDSLVQAIGDIRRGLGQPGREVVRTIPRRGYMLVAPATAPATDDQPQLSASTGLHRARSVLFVGSILACVALATLASLWLKFGAHGTTEANRGDRPSIAVLPFKDPNGNGEAQLLARGIAEDLVAELSRAHGLRVVSHQSSFQLAVPGTPLAQVGQQLRTRYLADGTVHREGEQLRILVELLDTQDGRVVWSFARLVDPAGVPAAQQALVGRIAGTLLEKVRNTEERRAVAQAPKSLDVYVLTAHGKSMMHKYSPQGMRDARRFFEQALAIDPNYAPAWVWLGMTNTIDSALRLTGEWHPGRVKEVLVQVERAVALEPELPIAHVALSQAQALARNFEGALASAERCVQLSPNDPDCLYIIGKAQLDMGQAEPAVRNMEQALDRNPVPPAYLPGFYATALWANHRYEEAIRTADDCLVRAPDSWHCRQTRIAALVELGRLAPAREEASRLMAQVPTMTAYRFGLIFADTAVALRDRRIAAARAAGIPAGLNP